MTLASAPIFLPLHAAAMSLSVLMDPTNKTHHVSEAMHGAGLETYQHSVHGGHWSNNASAMTLSVLVDPTDKTHRVSEAMYGAGLETYQHSMYGGLWSNMAFDDSMEDAQAGALDGITTRSWYAQGSNCSIVSGGAFNGAQSLALGSGCRAINRGLVVSEQVGSMHFVGGAVYEGYVFIRSSSGLAEAKTASQSAAVVRISLLCADLGQWGGSLEVLGSADLRVRTEGWEMASFSITPSRDCRQAAASTAKRHGLVMLESLAPTGTTVLADKLMVEPGPWGRYTTAGGRVLHVRKDLADAFLGQRPTIMRLGGSMTNAGGFRFANQTGPPWLRPPTDSYWIKHTSWGFGIFEFLQFAQSVPGLTPVLCVNYAEDMEQGHTRSWTRL